MSTKIIHVLKNDNFDEVFDLFKNIDAEEVIFIFPKGSKFAKHEQYFEAIKREADDSNKKVSVMSADPTIEQFSSKYALGLLQAPTVKKRSPAQPLPKPEGREDQESEILESGEVQAETAVENFYDAQPQTEPQIEAILTEAKPITRSIKQGRMIRDIFRPGTERPVEVREEKAKPFQINIRRELPEEKTNDIGQVWAAREKEAVQKPIFDHNLKRSSSSKFKKKGTFFLIAVILIFIFALYTTLGNTKVIINPQKQQLNFQLKISASSLTTAVNLEFNRIPGQHFGYKDEESGEFAASGEKNVVQKANGQITIYNKGLSEQRLVATTRFKSTKGLIFRIPQTITVPPASKNGEVIKEGIATSIVNADQAGVEYNISPDTFTIPGLEGTPKHEQFYAKSDKPMAGGIIGLSKVVTEEDFARAQEEISAKLKDKIIKSLKNQAGELEIVDSSTVTFGPPVTNVKTGEAANTLKMTMQGSANIIAFRKSDVLELIQNYISQKGNLELIQKDLKLSYLNSQNSSDGQTLTLNLQVSGQAAEKIDRDKILKDISGMKEDSIRTYFKNMKEIESAHVILSPFWVKDIPKDAQKIKIEINKD